MRENKMDFGNRNIVINHMHQEICIQVLADLGGNIKYDEFAKIRAGAYWEFIPPELVQDIRNGLQSGYQVKPVWLVGSVIKNKGNGHDWVVVQELAIEEEKKHMLYEKA